MEEGWQGEAALPDRDGNGRAVYARRPLGELEDLASGEWVRTFTIITTEANELVRALHDRMPVVIGPEDRETWLNGSDQQELLKPYPSELMTMRPVSKQVNSPKNDDPSLLNLVEQDTESSSSSEVKGANEATSATEPTNSE